MHLTYSVQSGLRSLTSDLIMIMHAPVWKESDVHRTCPVHRVKIGAQTGAQIV